MSDLQGLKILAFTWNTDGLSICENNIPDSSNRKVKGNFDWKHPFTKKECALPNFMEDLKQRLERAKAKGEQPHILVFTTQGEPENRSYFNEFLDTNPSFFSGYVRQSYEKLKGISEVQSGGKKRLYDDSTGALRQSIYVDYNLEPYIEKVTEDATVFKTGSWNETQTARGKDKSRNLGAIVTYLKIAKYGIFGFISVHLPSGIKRFGITEGDVHDEDYQYYRETMIAANRMFLVRIIKKFILDFKQKVELNYVLLMGDLNYGISEPITGPRGSATGTKKFDSLSFISYALSGQPPGYARKKAAANIAQYLYYNYDELYKELTQSKTRLNMFKEGVTVENGVGLGPMFLPNWRLESVDVARRGDRKFEKREPNCFDKSNNIIECYDKTQRHVAWKDRILYSSSSSRPEYLPAMICKQYELYDSGNITLSDHAAILGIYTVGDPQELLDMHEERFGFTDFYINKGDKEYTERELELFAQQIQNTNKLNIIQSQIRIWENDLEKTKKNRKSPNGRKIELMEEVLTMLYNREAELL